MALNAMVIGSCSECEYQPFTIGSLNLLRIKPDPLPSRKVNYGALVLNRCIRRILKAYCKTCGNDGCA